jgi:hypothetical protein
VITPFNAKDIERMKGRRFLLANLHKLHQEIAVISTYVEKWMRNSNQRQICTPESAVPEVSIGLDIRVIDSFRVLRLVEVLNKTCGNDREGQKLGKQVGLCKGAGIQCSTAFILLWAHTEHGRHM